MPSKALSIKPSSRATPEGVFCLASGEIDTHWLEFAHHLVRFCEETQEGVPEQLRADLKAARKQFWGFHDGESIALIGLTEVVGPVCWVWAICGAETYPQQIDRACEAVSVWAKDIGCTRMKIRGRLGWERRLEGFKRTAIILEKDL